MTKPTTALPDLLFVSGPHRSGTTFIHQWLADTGRYAFVTPFDLIYFDQLEALHAAGTLESTFATLDAELRAAQPDRGLDACGVGAGVAEEFGFLLPKTGEFSFFSPSLTPANRPRFELLRERKARLDSATPPRPLLLKNPDDHYTNFANLVAWYPTSRFVFIQRHPLVVLNSQARTWLKLLETRNTYFARVSPFYDAVMESEQKRTWFLALLRTRRWADQALSQLLASIDYFHAHAPALTPDRACALRYEDLCADPAHHLAQLHTFLDLPPPGPAAATAVQPRPIRLLPHVAEAFAARAADAAPRLTALGYDPTAPVNA